jgi:hypothetical protein
VASAAAVTTFAVGAWGSGSARPRPGGDPAAQSEATTPTHISYPVSGSRRFRVVRGDGPVLGTRGKVLRFRVTIERDIAGLDPAAVAAFVEETLGDPRGWTAGHRWRFRRVGPGRPYDFTVYLATPATRDVLCHSVRDRYTSCRYSKKVVLNIARWTRGVPHYHASLTTYRRYMVNHETGHFLGHDHELCPGHGRPAPVMLQQTYGLHGCVANPWPYRHGRRYRGPAGAYY